MSPIDEEEAYQSVVVAETVAFVGQCRNEIGIIRYILLVFDLIALAHETFLMFLAHMRV